MKFISSLAFVAALYISSTAAHLEKCPGSEKHFDLERASFVPDTINTSSEICMSIKGDLRVNIDSNGSMGITAEGPRGLKKSFRAGVFSFIRNPQGAQIAQGDEREFQACFYLPPEFQYTPSGSMIKITAVVTRKDGDGDDERVLCVRGPVRVA
ncbi:hypothetical protein B0O80DRAFT_496916 [Mortierella sp. GBAus27b]|nr:hypothetical protein BGX31_004026 [Mortierella sp. GBA43]KAI8357214.1 hypothetical protein B0O80DRAFT_496916 [Mortierella sp. GBAus27b]